MEKIFFHKKFTSTHFGGSANIETPDEASLIIVGWNNGGGVVPYNVLLPHQLYKADVIKTMRALRKEHGSQVEIVVIPASGDEWQLIASGSEKDGYTRYNKGTARAEKEKKIKDDAFTAGIAYAVEQLAHFRNDYDGAQYLLDESGQAAEIMETCKEANPDIFEAIRDGLRFKKK